MAISLYDISVASFLQTLGGVAGFLDKGLSHCETAGIDLNELVETRLRPDMLPFRFQVIAVAHHSLGAIEGVTSCWSLVVSCAGALPSRAICQRS